MIPYGRQDISESDIDAVVSVLRSDFLTQGPVVPRFEQALCERLGVRHAVAVNSATSALHVACLALGLGPGEVLWTVPNTFVASANCGRYCGAEVDFVDIDPRTWNMSVPALSDKLRAASRAKRLPNVLVPVHFAGQPTEQEAIWELAREFGVKVVEDASHSVGASRNGEPVGSCKWSDVTVFSFHPVKIITSGEGGVATTNDSSLFERMEMLRTHGITRDAPRFVGSSAGSWYYEQQLLGFNYRMTDLQAALGLAQLGRIDQFLARRNYLAERYDGALAPLPLLRPTVQPGNRSAYHLYVVRLRDGEGVAGHRRVMDQMRAAGIGVNVHYTPVHLQPYYARLGFRRGMYPESEAHGSEAMTLPLFPRLTDAEQDQVIRALESVL